MSTSSERSIFEPSPEASAGSWAEDWQEIENRAAADPLAYWEEQASELEWSQPWETVLDDSNAPFYKWFVGGKTNIVTNAVDRHITGPHKNKLALIWESEDGKEVRTFSYFSQPRC